MVNQLLLLFAFFFFFFFFLKKKSCLFHLLFLSQVFKALGEGAKHIPYRNSKLTHVLEDSLGGDAKTCMFINVSPADTNLSETMSTLLFGQV